MSTRTTTASHRATRIFAIAISGALLAGTAFAATGCPGTLDDPSKFTGPGTTTGDCDVEGDLFPTRCGDSACHDADAPAGSIDLVSPNVGDRVVGTASVSSCMPGILADPDDPTGSVLYVVLTEDSCTVFGQMPQNDTPLTTSELACVEEWIASLEGSTSTGMGGMGGTGGTGGAAAGGMGGMGGMGGN